LLHLIFLAVLLNNKGQFVTPGIIVNSPHWTIFRRAVGLLIIGKIITSFVGPIDQAIAADLGTGGIATLNYANKLISVFIGLGATAVARSILPVFSDRDAKVSEVTKLAKQWSLALILMGVVAVVCAYFLSHFLVEVVFQRGAFTAENTKEVAHVFNHGLLQLPFFFASIVLVQLFASRHLYWVLFVTSVLTIIVKSTASVVLSKSLGVAGIALGTGIMYFVNLMFLLYAMRYIEPNERLDHD